MDFSSETSAIMEVGTECSGERPHQGSNGKKEQRRLQVNPLEVGTPVERYRFT